MLTEAIRDALEAVSEHNKKKNEFIGGGGYEWGWHGHYYIECMDKATATLEAKIRQMVRDEIEALIQPTQKGTL